MKNKKKVIVIMMAVLLALGIGLGLFSNSRQKDSKKDYAIASDDKFSTLLADKEYTVSKKDIKKVGDTEVAVFNVKAKDLSADDVKKLAMNFYEYTMSKKTVDGVEVFVGENEVDYTSSFYADGLKYKVVIDKGVGKISLHTYNSVEANGHLGATEWTINDVAEKEGLLQIKVAVADDASKEDAMAQAKALVEQVKELNPDKEVKVAQVEMSNASIGYQYNTGFEDVLAVVENSLIE